MSIAHLRSISSRQLGPRIWRIVYEKLNRLVKLIFFMKSAVNSPATAILEETVSTRNYICNKGTQFIAIVTINWHRRLNVFTHYIFKSDLERNPSHLSFHHVDAFEHISTVKRL